jgi:hypothetical protein
MKIRYFLAGCSMILPWLAWSQSSYRPVIPKVWDETALKEWATPLASLNAQPKHMSPKQYYGLPVDNLKTYPVYEEGKEPPGYWEFLQKVGPHGCHHQDRGEDGSLQPVCRVLSTSCFRVPVRTVAIQFVSRAC